MNDVYQTDKMIAGLQGYTDEQVAMIGTVGVCERCGSEGHFRTDGWAYEYEDRRELECLCDFCAVSLDGDI